MATASDATSTLTGIMGNLSAAVRNTGLAMTVASGVAGGAMVAMAMNAQQVSSAFREVDTISREVSDAQAEYGKLVSDLNTEFGLQANRMEVIDGLYQSVSAGVTEGAEAQREFLETAAQLAVVGRVDLATTVDVLSTVMNTYGLETEQAQDVSESLFQTVQFGKVRMEELAPVLGRVAALGSELDTQIDEIGASMAVLTRTGFDARVAATGLRNIFRAMMRPSETMQQMLREIALENDLFADSMEESASVVRDIANEYQNATDALDRYEQKQSEARATSEESSLALQEARLKIQAIEEERLDQLPELTNKQVKQAESISELESVIDNYQFKVNKARVQEEKYRQDAEETQTKLTNLRQEFKQNVDAAGDLEGSVGNLVLGNQDFIETLVQLRERANEQNIAFNELFPRTRALQGALALVGEDGQALTEVFEQMESGTLDAREAWDGLDESARENFESFEAFKASTEDVQDGGLPEWFNEATGEQATMRNSVARLKEAVQDLGRIFSEDVTNNLQSFADAIERVSSWAKSLDETVRGNISRFMILLTTLGLLIGPLLFIGGQFALIAQALGTALLPVLVVAAGLFGAFAAGLQTAIQGGSEAEAMFTRLSGAFNSIIGYLQHARQAFNVLVAPELIRFGRNIVGIFDSVNASLSGSIGPAGGFNSTITQLAGSLGRVVEKMNQFLQSNKDAIVGGLVALVTYITSEAIPAVDDFVRGLLAIISDINWKLLLAIAVPAIVAVGKALVSVIGIVGRFMQNNSKLIGWVITIGAVFTSLLFTLGKLVPVFSAMGTVVSAVGAIIGATLVPGMSALGVAASIITPILSSLIPGFSTLALGLSALGTILTKAFIAVKIFVGGLATLAGALSTPVIIAGVLIAAFTALIASLWIAREEMKKIWETIKRDVFSIIGTLGDALSGEITWKEAGRRIVETLVSGLYERLSLLKKAATKVADTVKDYLGFGSAPPALGEDYNPNNYGKNVSTSFAEGMMNSEGEVKKATKSIAPSEDEFKMEELDFGSMGTDPGSQSENLESGFFDGDTGGANSQRRRSDMDSGSDITIDEKAIYFESGAFEGVSDEELPEKVRKVVDDSLDEIVEDVRARGADPN